jgi:hypothetical protein
MKRKIILMALVSAFILSNNIRSFGQATPKEIIDKFFDIYAKDPGKAVEYAFSTNKWMLDRKDVVENVKQKLNGTVNLCGEYSGYDKLSEKSAGESLKLISYYLKYDREPIRVTFFLYKPKDKWQVENFSFDESIGEAMEQTAKFYWLKENQ